MNKEQIKELQQRIDEVLYYVWDPIGVSDSPSARSEYSSYVKVILKYVLLEDLDKVTNQLNRIQSESIGLSIDKEKNQEVADKLIDFKLAIEEGLR
jgi:hypothetical protein